MRMDHGVSCLKFGGWFFTLATLGEVPVLRAWVWLRQTRRGTVSWLVARTTRDIMHGKWSAAACCHWTYLVESDCPCNLIPQLYISTVIGQLLLHCQSVFYSMQVRYLSYTHNIFNCLSRMLQRGYYLVWFPDSSLKGVECSLEPKLSVLEHPGFRLVGVSTSEREWSGE